MTPPRTPQESNQGLIQQDNPPLIVTIPRGTLHRSFMTFLMGYVESYARMNPDELQNAEDYFNDPEVLIKAVNSAYRTLGIDTED